MPSGTTRFGSVCQPALPSPSTMMRSRPAPASRANSPRSAAKNGLDTPFDTYQKVSPEPEHDHALASRSAGTRSPAPASRANNARSAAKNGLEMPFEMYQNTSPEI